MPHALLWFSALKKVVRNKNTKGKQAMKEFLAY